MRSNCYVYAFRAWRRRREEWIAAGRPEWREPALRLRDSRLEPRKILHAQVEFCESGVWVIEQFVPDDPRPLRWWQWWRAIWCKGHVKRGDAKD